MLEGLPNRSKIKAMTFAQRLEAWVEGRERRHAECTPDFGGYHGKRGQTVVKWALGKLRSPGSTIG
jgi:hypothetical protein